MLMFAIQQQVNTMIYLGKQKNVDGIKTKRPDWKKAIVTLDREVALKWPIEEVEKAFRVRADLVYIEFVEPGCDVFLRHRVDLRGVDDGASRLGRVRLEERVSLEERRYAGIGVRTISHSSAA